MAISLFHEKCPLSFCNYHVRRLFNEWNEWIPWVKLEIMVRKTWSKSDPFLKFIYSEKATNFCKISSVHLSYVVTVKSTVEISQNFVAFSEYMNLTDFCISKNGMLFISGQIWNTQPDLRWTLTHNIPFSSSILVKSCQANSLWQRDFTWPQFKGFLLLAIPFSRKRGCSRWHIFWTYFIHNGLF